jgi:sigma54-dependent transcription regulator
MTDDIVTRLRKAWDEADPDASVGLTGEAADEIERLRKRLEVYENALNVIDTTISMTDWKAHLVSDGVETADEIVIALVKECADD